MKRHIYLMLIIANIFNCIEAKALSINSFQLVSSENKVLSELSGEETINLATLPTRDFSVRAITYPDKVGSVRFSVNDIRSYQMENALPYSMNGDIKKRYPIAWKPQAGLYTITATPFSRSNGKGSAGTSQTIRLKIIDEEPPKVVGFNLINVDTNSAMRKIVDGEVLNLAVLPTKNIAIEAIKGPSQVGSIKFALNGDLNYRLENKYPFSISGDSKGVFKPFDLSLGSYEIAATPFSEKNEAGLRGETSAIKFKVIDRPLIKVTSLSLINTDSNEVVKDIKDGDVINLAELPSKNISIRANTSPYEVGSVIFGLDDIVSFKTENRIPYAINGDDNGLFVPLKLSLGQHKVTAMPYADANGSGLPGEGTSINFEIKDILPVPVLTLFTPIGGSSQTIHGDRYNVHSAEKDWSIGKSTNAGIYRFELHQGENRANGNDPDTKDRSELEHKTDIPKGKETWGSYSFMIEKGDPILVYLDTVIGQWHSDQGVAPPLTFQFYKEKFRVASRSGTSRNRTFKQHYLADMKREEWNHLVFRIKFDTNDRGLLQVWLNGKQIVNEEKANIGYSDSAYNYWKFGIYRKTYPIPLSMQYANMEISNSSLFDRVAKPLVIKP
jgi:hypothetical protein